MSKRTGACHCGAVTYEVEIDLTKPSIECNCSYCEKQGLILSFVSRESFTLTEGEGNVTQYNFNTGKIDHFFCKTCGVQCFGHSLRQDGTPGAAINVRTIDGIDMTKVEKMPFDGRSR